MTKPTPKPLDLRRALLEKKFTASRQQMDQGTIGPVENQTAPDQEVMPLEQSIMASTRNPTASGQNSQPSDQSITNPSETLIASDQTIPLNHRSAAPEQFPMAPEHVPLAPELHRTPQRALNYDQYPLASGQNPTPSSQRTVAVAFEGNSAAPEQAAVPPHQRTTAFERFPNQTAVASEIYSVALAHRPRFPNQGIVASENNPTATDQRTVPLYPRTTTLQQMSRALDPTAMGFRPAPTRTFDQRPLSPDQTPMAFGQERMSPDQRATRLYPTGLGPGSTPTVPNHITMSLDQSTMVPEQMSIPLGQGIMACGQNSIAYGHKPTFAIQTSLANAKRLMESRGKFGSAVYTIAPESEISSRALLRIVMDAFLNTPSPYQFGSARGLILLGEEHEKLWEITLEAFRAVAPHLDFSVTESEVERLRDGFGTVSL